MSKVFMDAGSGINLIYADTLRAMNISLTNLAPTTTTFHGIVPMSAVLPLGKHHPGRHLRQARKLQARGHRLRGRRLAIPVQRHPGATRCSLGSWRSPLPIPQAEDPRAQRA